MYYSSLFELNDFLLDEEIKWNNLEKSLILAEVSAVLKEDDSLDTEDDAESNGPTLADKVEVALKKFGAWLKGLFDKVVNFFSNFIDNVEQIFKGIKRAITDNSITEAMERNKDWKKISVTIPDTRSISAKLTSNAIDIKTPEGIRKLDNMLSSVEMVQLKAVISNAGTLINFINSTTRAKKYVLNMSEIVESEIKQANSKLARLKKDSESAQEVMNTINTKKSVLMKLVKMASRFANIVRTQYMTIFKFIRRLCSNGDTKSKYAELERSTNKRKKY